MIDFSDEKKTSKDTINIPLVKCDLLVRLKIIVSSSVCIPSCRKWIIIIIINDVYDYHTKPRKDQMKCLIIIMRYHDFYPRKDPWKKKTIIIFRSVNHNKCYVFNWWNRISQENNVTRILGPFLYLFYVFISFPLFINYRFKFLCHMLYFYHIFQEKFMLPVKHVGITFDIFVVISRITTVIS